MARSSKSQSQSRPSKSKSKASVARWERDGDIPLDEQEEFHTSRDRILLEGEDDADEDFEDDDEVFALRGVGVDEDSSSGSPSDSEEPTTSSASTSASTKKTKSKSKKKKAEKKKDEEEEDEEEGWGRKKSVYYATGDDDEHDDDEEAARLQEEEARRVQAKMRADMTDDDFGLGDLRIADPAPDATADPTASTSVTTATATALPKEKDALRAHLARHSPETLALAREWDDVAHALLKATRALEKTQAAKPDALSLGLLHVHHQTLQTYATTLAFYFHLRASEPYAARPELLRAHPILKRLLTLKQALATLEELDFGGSSSDEEDSEEDESTDADLDEDEDEEDDDAGWRQLELADLLKDSTTHGELDAADGIQRRARVKSLKAQPLESIPELHEPSKKAKKKTKVTYDLVEPAFVSSKSSSSGKNKITDTDTDGFGDPMVLQSADAADKKARRRTLQFHAARIDAGAARRAGARAARMGGDEDVPYPERKKEAEKRRAEENARRRARGEDLDDEEPVVERPRKRQRDQDEEEEGDGDGDEEGYYELVSRGRKEAKKAKREAYEAERAAERVVDDDADETNGPRALTRAILKNKGLTPHRAKSVRNPRVKKKLRYEKAKKKVASQKAVFKGGAAASKGVYEGEKSGINSRVVKSTRLG